MVSLVKRWAWRTRKRFTPRNSLNGAFPDCIFSKPKIVQWPWAMRTSCVPSVQHPALCFCTLLRKQYQRYNIQTITELSSYLYLLRIHLALSLIQWVFLLKLPLVFIPFSFLMAGRSQKLYFKACYPCCEALSTGKSCTENPVWFQKSYNWGL